MSNQKIQFTFELSKQKNHPISFYEVIFVDTTEILRVPVPVSIIPEIIRRIVRVIIISGRVLGIGIIFVFPYTAVIFICRRIGGFRFGVC